MIGGAFLQSKEWEEFQRSLGRKTWRIKDVLLIQHKLPLDFNYLYCPRPQIVDWNFFLAEAERVALKEKSIFLKIELIDKSQITNYKLQISDSIQPRKTIILDLEKSENEILAGMREKTRYNIRLAEKKGVEIEKVEGSEAISEFLNLLKETAFRDNFRTHPEDYYKKMLFVRSVDFSNELFFAKHQGKILAAAMVNFYGDIATYLHGASNRTHKEIMAPQALHWAIIKESKKRDFKYYDFWGIDEKKWPGVTRFKLGFGGKISEFPLAFDVIFRRFWYGFYRLAKFVKRA